MKRTTDDRDDDTEGHMPRIKPSADEQNSADTDGHMPRIKPSADDDTNDAAVDTEGHTMKFRP